MIEQNPNAMIENSDNNLYKSILKELIELKDDETGNDNINVQNMLTENFSENLLQISKEDANRLVQAIDSIENVTDPVIINQLNNLKNLLLPIAGYSALDSYMMIDETRDRHDKVGSDVLDEKLIQGINEGLGNLKTRIKKYLSSIKDEKISAKLKILSGNIDKIYKVLNTKSHATNKNFESIWNFLKVKGCVQGESFAVGEVIPGITDFLNKTNEYFDTFDAAGDSFNEVASSNAFIALENYLEHPESGSNLDVEGCIQFIKGAKLKGDQTMNNRIFDMYLHIQGLDADGVNHPDFSSIEDTILANYDIDEIGTYEMNKYFEGKTLQQLKDIYPENWDGSELTQVSGNLSEFFAASDEQILKGFNKWNSERIGENNNLLQNLDILSVLGGDMDNIRVYNGNLYYSGEPLNAENLVTQLGLVDKIGKSEISSKFVGNAEIERVLSQGESNSILTNWLGKIKEKVDNTNVLSVDNIKKLWSNLNAADVVDFYTSKKENSAVLTNKQYQTLQLLYTGLTSQWEEKAGNPAYDAIKKIQEMVNVTVDGKFGKNTFNALKEKFKDLIDVSGETLHVGNKWFNIERDEEGAYIMGRGNKKRRNVSDVPNYTGEGYLYENGVLYWGNFVDGKMDGDITCISENGQKTMQYEGGYYLVGGGRYLGKLDRNFKFTGNGRIEYNDGTFYEGTFQNGKSNGRGIYGNQEKPIYIGQYNDGKCNGYGFLRSGNVVRYGQRENGTYLGNPENLDIQGNIEKSEIYQRARELYPKYFTHLDNDIDQVHIQIDQ